MNKIRDWIVVRLKSWLYKQEIKNNHKISEKRSQVLDDFIANHLSEQFVFLSQSPVCKGGVWSYFQHKDGTFPEINYCWPLENIFVILEDWKGQSWEIVRNYNVSREDWENYQLKKRKFLDRVPLNSEEKRVLIWISWDEVVTIESLIDKFEKSL